MPVLPFQRMSLVREVKPLLPSAVPPEMAASFSKTNETVATRLSFSSWRSTGREAPGWITAGALQEARTVSSVGSGSGVSGMVMSVRE